MDERTDPATAKSYGMPPASRETVVRPRARRRLLPGLVVLAVIGGAIFLAHPWGAKGPAQKTAQTPPQPVGVATATTGDMPVILNALGTVSPIATVTVKTQINGQLMQLGFQEGQMVEKSQFLAEIDPRPYQVALEQAEGQLAHDTALLHQAQSDLARYQKLKAQNSIAEQQVADQAFLVQQYQGTTKTDQAAIDNAKLNLAYCRITAPIAGRAGLRQVDVGNYVQASDANGIVVISQLDPISVVFSLPQNDIAEVTKAMQGSAPLAVAAYDSANTTKLASGKLTAMDNQINVSTGTVQLRAEFANPGNRLFPNEFVNVQLLVETLHGVVLVPQAAIQRGAPGTFVYVVKPDNTVALQKVTLGPGNASEVSIASGLKAGERVVTDGADRLHPDAKVSVVAANAASAASGTAAASGSIAAMPAHTAAGAKPAGQPAQ